MGRKRTRTRPTRAPHAFTPTQLVPGVWVACRATVERNYEWFGQHNVTHVVDCDDEDALARGRAATKNAHFLDLPRNARSTTSLQLTPEDMEDLQDFVDESKDGNVDVRDRPISRRPGAVVVYSTNPRLVALVAGSVVLAEGLMSPTALRAALAAWGVKVKCSHAGVITCT